MLQNYHHLIVLLTPWCEEHLPICCIRMFPSEETLCHPPQAADPSGEH